MNETYGHATVDSPLPPMPSSSELQASVGSPSLRYFESFLKYKLDNDEIDPDLATELGDIFGISLNREYEFRVTVEFTGSFSLPLGYDPDTVLDNINWSGEQYYNSTAEDFEVADANMTYTDIQEVS